MQPEIAAFLSKTCRMVDRNPCRLATQIKAKAKRVEQRTARKELKKLLVKEFKETDTL